MSESSHTVAMITVSSQFESLVESLRPLGSCLVAMSGGVDSSVVAMAARKALGNEAQAVTVVSRLTSPRDAVRARAAAIRTGIGYNVVQLDLLSVPEIQANGPDRCYYCKSVIFQTLAQSGLPLVDGTTADDDPSRPGRRALRELGVFSPLEACGLTKKDVRAIARYLRLFNADEPSESCLATRVKTGMPLEAGLLQKVADLEDVLLREGVSGCRAKVDGTTVLYLYPSGAAPLADELRMVVEERAMAHGFTSITFAEMTHEP